MCILGACQKSKDPAPNYRYQLPKAQDEIAISSLEAEGINQEVIAQLSNSIIKEGFKRIDAFLILKTIG